MNPRFKASLRARFPDVQSVVVNADGYVTGVYTRDAWRVPGATFSATVYWLSPLEPDDGFVETLDDAAATGARLVTAAFLNGEHAQAYWMPGRVVLRSAGFETALELTDDFGVLLGRGDGECMVGGDLARLSGKTLTVDSPADRD